MLWLRTKRVFISGYAAVPWCYTLWLLTVEGDPGWLVTSYLEFFDFAWGVFRQLNYLGKGYRPNECLWHLINTLHSHFDWLWWFPLTFWGTAGWKLWSAIFWSIIKSVKLFLIKVHFCPKVWEKSYLWNKEICIWKAPLAQSAMLIVTQCHLFPVKA